MTGSQRLPDLPALRLLVGVARTGSIGATAREQGVSQQAASERLRSAETLTGLTLLRRGSRGSELTPSGVVLVEWATRLLDAADEVAAAIDGLRSDRARDLSVAASMTVAEALVPRWLVLLRRRQESAGLPATTVSLAATNSRHVVTAVREGRADLGFVEGTTAPADVRSRPVGADELVLVAPAGSALARRRAPLGPAEVAALALTSREPGSGTRQVVESALAGHGLRMSAPVVELTTASAVREAVRAGSAPAFLSRRLVDRDVDAGHLVVVPTSGLALRRTFRAVWVGSATPPAGPVRDLVAIARSVS